MKRGSAIVAVACLSIWTGMATAQQPPAPSSAQMLLASDTLVGSTVRTPDGRDVGKVTRLMIDPNDGRVLNVVVSTGATLGLGGSTVSVPWSSVKVGQDRGRVVVTLNQMLDTAPKAERPSTAPSASPPTAPPAAVPAPQPR